MKYTVNIKEVHIAEIEVDADSPEQARERALEIYPENYDYSNLVYSHTMDKEHWTVNPIP